MDRIMIFGFSGGGKSTLARKMGEILGIEPTHFDRLHWLPNWVESTREYKREMIKPILERDRWIIEGNYHHIYWNERLEKADTVIFIIALKTHSVINNNAVLIRHSRIRRLMIPAQ